MAAMHYNARSSDDHHQHSRLLYEIRGRLHESEASPELENNAVRHSGSPLRETSETISRDEDANYEDDRYRSNAPFLKDTETTSEDERRSSSGLIENQKFGPHTGKTSFCIDALLGKAAAKQSDHGSYANLRRGMSYSMKSHRQSESTSTTAGSEPFALRSYSCYESQDAEDPAALAHQVQDNPRCHNGNLDETTDPEDVDVEVDVSNRGSTVNITRTGSTSPGSSRSPSPPISPGSEDPNLVNGSGGASVSCVPPKEGSHLSGPYGSVGVATAIHMRQNSGQTLLLHSGGPIVHPSGLYYHPTVGASAFHSIHKEGQSVQGHPQSAVPHPQQHHIHPLQLEWLARTGMLYPRLPADLAGMACF